jgi:hypothetical protein
MKVSKKRNEITREEWILYHWVGVQEIQDEEPIYIRGNARDISKSVQAAQQWDEWHAAYNALYGINDDA